MNNISRGVRLALASRTAIVMAFVCAAYTIVVIAHSFVGRDALVRVARGRLSHAARRLNAIEEACAHAALAVGKAVEARDDVRSEGVSGQNDVATARVRARAVVAHVVGRTEPPSRV